jgi:dienelactone hydrolase
VNHDKFLSPLPTANIRTREAATMSEPDIATKAPESDAQADTTPATGTIQPSPISATDSVAQTGASMGDHCTTDRPLPANLNTQSSGTITTLNGIETYISKPADYPSTPAKLLLLLTNGTGIHSLNNQLQADTFATHGFLVVMPDQFGGDTAPNSTNKATSPTEETASPSIIERVKLSAVNMVGETAKSFMIDMWLARQTPEKVLPRLTAILEGVKDEYADAVAFGGGVYAVGYCFGGKYVLILGSEEEGQAQTKAEEAGDEESTPAIEGKKALIKCGAIAHATLVTREDLKNLKVPTSMVVVQNDPLFPEEVLDAGRKYLASGNVENEIEVYEGVPHGFAVMGEYEDQKIKESQEKAMEQIVSWLKAH